jgi:hypothetical protein
MNKENSSFYIFISILIAVTTILSMAGCSGSPRAEKWKEEVRLSSGKIIVVERETLRERGGDEIASNRSGTKPKKRIIRFVNPNGSKKIIEWRSTKLDDVRWPEKHLILDLESGDPVVYTIVYVSGSCEVYSKYVYRNGIWSEEKLPEKFKVRTTNLFIRDGVDMPKFVDLAKKQKGNDEIGYRKSLKQVGPTRKVCE